MWLQLNVAKKNTKKAYSRDAFQKRYDGTCALWGLIILPGSTAQNQTARLLPGV